MTTLTALLLGSSIGLLITLLVFISYVRHSAIPRAYQAGREDERRARQR